MKIAPSILSANFWHLGSDIEKVISSGAEILHFDVMDGNFVPNISFGIPVLKTIRPYFDITADVHLMINHPLSYIKSFSDAGADIINFHVECLDDINKTIDEITTCGKKPALTVKPGTPIEAVFPYIDRLFMVLIMTVEPGFGGQKFIIEMLEKVKELKKRYPHILAEVDGGINEQTVKLCKSAGVDICVAGSAVFSNRDIAASYKKLAAE